MEKPMIDNWDDIPTTKILHGDCMQLLKTLPDNSIDAIVTDPPYGMSPDGIARTWADIEEGRKLSGFMGKDWDAAVPCHNFFAECLRVLKHGGHMIAFSSTRTVCALGMAAQQGGFVIRDMIHWCYFSGFPKSHDISKAIDRECIKKKMYKEFALHFREQRKKSKLTQKDIAKFFPSKTGGLTGCVWNWENAANVPTLDQWEVLQPMIDLSLEYLPLIERVEAERKVIGNRKSQGGRSGSTCSVGQGLIDYGKEIPVTKPATQDAQKWAGFGTALKPAVEPALLLRKPLEKGLTIAQNVLKHGTGALNIDACRFGYGDPCWVGPQEQTQTNHTQSNGDSKNGWRGNFSTGEITINTQGRWPANLYQCAKASRSEREEGLDHLETTKGFEAVHRKEGSAGLDNPRAGAGRTANEVRNIHPTVKPIKLMRWCCRLVGGQKGSVILDPFTGSGTTGAAALLEGFDFVGMELTPEYLPIIDGRIEAARKQYKLENAQLSLFEEQS
jgi:DNA modification methylase